MKVYNVRRLGWWVWRRGIGPAASRAPERILMVLELEKMKIFWKIEE
jgi:hypothetical protein